MAFNTEVFFVVSRYPIALLFLLLCLIAFKLPILIIYFNQLLLGAERASFLEIKEESHHLAQPSSPYFLTNGGTISPEVNQALEAVRHFSIFY